MSASKLQWYGLSATRYNSFVAPRYCNTYIIILALVSLMPGLMTGCSRDRDLTLLEAIKERGELRVVTRNGPTTYYEGPLGPQGLEYDLASLFAKKLGVKLKITTEDDLNTIFFMLKNGDADLAAAGLTITRKRQASLLFGPPYHEVTQQLVFRSRNNQKRPRKIADLIGRDIDVAANSSHVDTLVRLKEKYPELEWHEHRDMDSSEILELVWSQFADYTIANSTEIKLLQRFMPELTVAFNVSKPQKVAWAFDNGIDLSLYHKATEFFDRIKKDGTLKQLINRYFGHVRSFSYVGTQTYMRDIAKVLPKYRHFFISAAKKHNLDWRLLAAIGYQESHWKENAVSPTGVKGIMMLTKDTAKFLNIKNRRNPVQSINGGAKYFRYMLDKIPDRIPEPDRTWMALAAYNVGYGHLEDARIITQKRGKDPDKWVDVRESLPLLSKKRWYSKTRYGYARGHEPVKYVANIRNYYELLVWQEESGTRARVKQQPLNIMSPAL